MTFCFFFNDTATTEIYTLSLHDALPIFMLRTQSTRTAPATAPEPPASRTVEGDGWTSPAPELTAALPAVRPDEPDAGTRDRKSTRLNSSHANISYAVFCLKKKNTTNYRN